MTASAGAPLADLSAHLTSRREATFRVVFPLAYGPGEDATEVISRN